MVDTKNVLEVRYDKTGLLVMIVIGIGFVILGLLLFFHDPNGWVVPVLAIGAFGPIVLLHFGAAFDKQAPLQIDSNGLRWRLYSGKEIPWDDIEEAKVERLFLSSFLVLKLRSPPSCRLGEGMSTLRSSTIRLGQINSWLNKVLGYGDIQINAHILDTSLYVIMKTIEENISKSHVNSALPELKLRRD